MARIASASVDVASQTTLTAVQTKLNNLMNGYVYMQLLPRRGKAVAGTWVFNARAAATEWKSDVLLDTAGTWDNDAAPAQNDEYAYPVFLPAGTYSFELYSWNKASCGILNLYLGTTLKGTIDCYNVGSVYNSLATISFVLAADFAGNLRLVMATKNGAATGYDLFAQKMTLWRTL